MAAVPDYARLLLVDDDAMLRMLPAESLRHAGFAVTEADDGEAALQLFDDHDFDLMLLDVMMPGIEAYAVCESIRRRPRAVLPPVKKKANARDPERHQTKNNKR